MTQRIHDFLRRYGMHPELFDMGEITDRFVGHMRAGLAGEESSLMMIPTYFSAGAEIQRGGKVIALDAGGTNFRAALTALGEDDVRVLRSEVFPMPGSRGGITKAAFLDEVCSHIEPMLRDANDIGFCFSFPAEITPRRDGRLVGFNKEVRVSDSEGMLVCAELRERLSQRGAGEVGRFVLLNDTIAAMLGGMASGPREGDYIGFILGTGTNSCYSERGEAIQKLGSPEGDMILNMEAGGFNGLPTGDFDRALDAGTDNPGDHIYEKMVAGGYLGELCLLTLRGAAKEGLLGPEAAKALASLEELPLEQVSIFLAGEGGVLAEVLPAAEDCAAAKALCLALIERAAKLAVCNIAAILLQADIGKTPARPAVIVAEGSTFWKAYSFKACFDRFAEAYIGKTLGRCYVIHSAENLTLAGCAVAASMG